MTAADDLPWRRPALAEKLTLANGVRLHARAGFDPRDGRLAEIFMRGATPAGSERDLALDDQAVLASKLLQRGAAAAEIARWLTPGGPARAALEWADSLRFPAPFFSPPVTSDGEPTQSVGRAGGCVEK